MRILILCFLGYNGCCACCHTANTQEPGKNAGCCDKLQYAFMCPPHGKVAKLTCLGEYHSQVKALIVNEIIVWLD